MILQNKILTLSFLFGVKAAIYLIDGMLSLAGGASYGEYGDVLVNAAIMGYITYAIYSTRSKWIYLLAVFFAGMTFLRAMTGVGLISFTGISLSVDLTILAVLDVLIFSVIPIFILLDKDIRSAFFSMKNM